MRKFNPVGCFMVLVFASVAAWFLTSESENAYRDILLFPLALLVGVVVGIMVYEAVFPRDDDYFGF